MLKLVGVALSAVALLVVAGCGSGKDERGLRYMPDMYDSPAKKSQEAWRKEAVLDEDGNVISPAVDYSVMLQPVDGSVPRDFNPYDIADTPEGLEEAKLLPNPVTPTVQVLRRGRDRYDIYCAVCHGKDGQAANSYVAGEGRVQGIVSITTPGVAAYPDGQIYHIITHGRGRMPHYRAQLLPEDRWAVIHYLRSLHAATSAEGDALDALKELDDDSGEQFEPLPEPVPEYLQQDWPDKIQREDDK